MCYDGNPVAVQKLLDEGADPNEVERDEANVGDNWPPHCGLGRSPLHLACQQGHLQVLIACDEGYLEVARLLLDHGADSDKADSL